MATITTVLARTYTNKSNAQRAMRGTNAYQQHPERYWVNPVEGGFAVQRSTEYQNQCNQVVYMRAKANAKRVKPAEPIVSARTGGPVGVTLNRGGSKGIKIEANREVRNGMARPSAGGITRKVWDYCDATMAEAGRQPTAAETKAWAAANGINPTTAILQRGYWRKFMGFTAA